jgi:LCP family protein required for cell wall assembly
VKLLPRTRGGALWRFALASLLVIGFTAATTAVAGLLQVKQIEDFIDQTPALTGLKGVPLPQPGAPETLLLIGSDHRAGDPYNAANTDTMMLVRVDDASSTINMLSVPRDLEVTLPGCGQCKLNAAYSIGGPNLLLHTLKTQVFPGLVVNHILDINFGGFADLVDAIGCVYTDVDHRYYNNTALTDYSSIDIQPGYQKLCGTDALAFVRFRHTDSDIVRNSRQQDFLRWAKDQFSISQLLNERDKLLKIFGRHVQTDHSLHTVDGLISLFDLLINADAHTIRQIPFPALFGACDAAGQTPCFVTATPRSMAAAYKKFITPTTAASAHKSSGRRPHRSATPTAGLTADVADARNQALALGRIGFPVYYPRLIPKNTFEWVPQYCSDVSGNCNDPANPASVYSGAYPRAYHIHASGGGIYPAYRMTVVLNSALGEYYGIQGTTWLHPPILNANSSVRNVNGKNLQLFFNGAHLSLVAWHTPQAVYWVSNSLADALTNSQLIGIAASLTRAP